MPCLFPWDYEGRLKMTKWIEQMDSFFAKVDKTDKCWLWTATKNKHGYGQFYDRVKKHTRLATHVSIEIATGVPFPVGMHACHSCDNPPCVNPDHLFLGTQKQNIRDGINKGRILHPSKKPGYMHPKKRQTHCIHGHAFDKENTIIKRGCRQCRKCAVDYAKEYNKKYGKTRVRNKGRESLRKEILEALKD